MKLLEHQGKQLLAQAGVPVPRGRVVTTPEAAQQAAAVLGCRVALKAQVPAGKRGKAGGIGFADTPEDAAGSAARLLGSELAGSHVDAVLVEEAADIAKELYASVLNDPAGKGPLVLFCPAGGMDIEELSARDPESIRRLGVDIRTGLTADAARSLVTGLGLGEHVEDQVTTALLTMYRLYRTVEAELVEVNPLVVTGAGEVVALDSKISLDPGALGRHAELLADLVPARDDTGTELERRGRELGLQYLELDGEVGVLANGAGLTMTTLDAVTHYGGKPANFLEIGGDAYTKATPALRLVLDNPRVRSLVVNFCGAFARTDVMTEGVLAAIEELRPELPIFFSIHGTGEEKAIRLVRERLGVEPYDTMDDAVKAAVAAAAGPVEGKVAG
ncbi:succinate--CoA ligase subunit beta [Prauserella endophytica]|uniref:Succinate--CoA ligase n=1 Tax=Prauserella endophytica TaxID=1592324 RepID=A0ABY2SAZ3_9PSEU|nr:ATP-grasp domain-containing protein [Prauserella endophytica]PXY29149.1 succinate--CoA ligase [Prauserella coralliicola]TKG72843.1 succinate--CoA ligase [Prauserella endophytica]